MGHASKNEVLVSFLREIKPTCGICLVTTASRRNALDLLERFGMLELFDGFVFGEDVEQGKPSPEAYLKAMDLMGADADRCIAIEDSEAGLASARAAGLLVAKVSWHAKGWEMNKKKRLLRTSANILRVLPAMLLLAVVGGEKRRVIADDSLFWHKRNGYDAKYGPFPHPIVLMVIYPEFRNLVIHRIRYWGGVLQAQ